MRIHLANSSPATQFFYVLDFLNPFSASHHADRAGQPRGPQHRCAVHRSGHPSARPPGRAPGLAQDETLHSAS